MKLLNLISLVYLVLTLFSNFSQQYKAAFNVSLIKSRISPELSIESRGKSTEKTQDEESRDCLVNSTCSDTSNCLENTPPYSSRTDLEDSSVRSEKDLGSRKVISEEILESSTGNIESGEENDEEKGKESLHFNSHRCLLILAFEIEFLENPVLNDSGIVKYIREIEVNSEGVTINKPKLSEDVDKFKILELETKNKKMEEIISFMKQILHTCNFIESQESMEEFKDEILGIIEAVEEKIRKIDSKLEKLMILTDKKSSKFHLDSYQKNMISKSKLQGKKSAFTLALTSFKRIEDYWIHLENMYTLD
ncbi:hypothetical protein HWI79_1285 [Cryptosporidium felis]|nr:hypothetical protein HWI79_1285 [Cryptosporidium felis]